MPLPKSLRPIPVNLMPAYPLTVVVKAIILSNPTDAPEIEFTVTDGNGVPLMDGYKVYAHGFIVVPLYGTIFTNGVKWCSNGVDGATGAIITM